MTGGYTEMGGMPPFLEKINPHVRWQRCFPTKMKPKGKFSRNESAPRVEQRGITGKSLVENMLSRLQKYYRSHDYDYFLLIDDLDCRFNGDGDQYESWKLELSDQVNKALERETNTEVLFASPEIEAWFVADWENSFGKEYRTLSHPLKSKLKIEQGKNFWNSPESYGGALVNGSCEFKLSETIQRALSETPNNQTCRYSKRTNGAAMLGRIEPGHVAHVCRLYFAPV